MILRVLINDYASVAFDVLVSGEWRKETEVGAVLRIQNNLNVRLLEKGVAFTLESLEHKPRFGRISEIFRNNDELLLKLAF